jgi:glycine dehydrogenase subunit 1
MYDHFIPTSVDAIISRGDFFTAYTPYQAEVSQGTLQAIFEYQTMICELTGLDVANASHYDGASALAAAVEMIFQQGKKKSTILYSPMINPRYLEVLFTQFRFRDYHFQPLPVVDGAIDVDAVAGLITKETAGLIFQNPNYFGIIEKVSELATIASEANILSAVSQNPMTLAWLKRPGDVGIDIATGEGQPLGIPISFGGPGLGYMSCTKKMMRKMPGRIVGQTEDEQGRTGYVLTLQAREQHIRREKASSNICSNQGLCALAAVVYLSTVGTTGLKRIAEYCLKAAHYAQNAIATQTKAKILYPKGQFFHEFAIDCGRNAREVFHQIIEEYAIAPGIPLDFMGKEHENHLLIAITEKKTQSEIDQLINALKEVI